MASAHLQGILQAALQAASSAFVPQVAEERVLAGIEGLMLPTVHLQGQPALVASAAPDWGVIRQLQQCLWASSNIVPCRLPPPVKKPSGFAV